MYEFFHSLPNSMWFDIFLWAVVAIVFAARFFSMSFIGDRPEIGYLTSWVASILAVICSAFFIGLNAAIVVAAASLIASTGGLFIAELFYNTTHYGNPLASFFSSKRNPIGAPITKHINTTIKTNGGSITVKTPVINRDARYGRRHWGTIEERVFKPHHKMLNILTCELATFDWSEFVTTRMRRMERQKYSESLLTISSIKNTNWETLETSTNLYDAVKEYLEVLLVKGFNDDSHSDRAMRLDCWATNLINGIPVISCSLSHNFGEGSRHCWQFKFFSLNHRELIAAELSYFWESYYVEVPMFFEPLKSIFNGMLLTSDYTPDQKTDLNNWLELPPLTPKLLGARYYEPVKN